MLPLFKGSQIELKLDIDGFVKNNVVDFAIQEALGPA